MKVSKMTEFGMFGLKLSGLASVIIMAAVVSPALAGDGNGGGTNGPITNGMSIPLKLDQGISIGRLQKAANVCMILGDKEKGVTSRLEELNKQIFGKASEDYNHSAKLDPDLIANGLLLRGGYYLFKTGDSGRLIEKRKLEIIQNPTVRSEKFGAAEYKWPAGTLVVELFDYTAGLSNTILYTKAPLPVIKWEKVVPEYMFDHLGNDAKVEDYIVMGVRIEIPALTPGSGQLETTENVALYNFVSKKQTRHSVNVLDYIECLQNEIH